VIAHFAEATKPQLRRLPDETTKLLAELIARRRQIDPSVEWRGNSFIGGGRKRVRSSVFVGAMVVARYNPQLKQFR
jgi:transposase